MPGGGGRPSGGEPDLLGRGLATPLAAATMPMRPAAVRLVSWNGADDGAQRPRLTIA
ncbi:Uncharacterised protein [Mycobacteroides abscessus]|nr:Uncharacterised protein [Mycobacteroides abscessus]